MWGLFLTAFLPGEWEITTTAMVTAMDIRLIIAGKENGSVILLPEYGSTGTDTSTYKRA